MSKQHIDMKNREMKIYCEYSDEGRVLINQDSLLHITFELNNIEKFRIYFTYNKNGIYVSALQGISINPVAGNKVDIMYKRT